MKTKMSELIIELPYPLRSKSNFRRGVKDKEWNNYKNFEKITKLLLLSKKPEDWVTTDGAKPVNLRNKVVVCIVSRTTLDVGNYSKSLLDAAEGILFHNDSEVSGLACIGDRGRSNYTTLVGFKQLSPEATLLEVNTGLAELTEKVLFQFSECLKNNKENNV